MDVLGQGATVILARALLGPDLALTLLLAFIVLLAASNAALRPLPEFCPLMMRNFQKLDEALADDAALLGKTHLLSIGFDTAFDTPEVLRSFGSAFIKDRGNGRFAHWELATGSPQQITAVADYFGLVFWGEEGQITHSLCTPIVAADGRVAKVYRDNLYRRNRQIHPLSGGCVSLSRCQDWWS